MQSEGSKKSMFRSNVKTHPVRIQTFVIKTQTSAPLSRINGKATDREDDSTKSGQIIPNMHSALKETALSLQITMKRLGICVVVLAIISLGALAGFGWNVWRTDNQSKLLREKIEELEKIIQSFANDNSREATTTALANKSYVSIEGSTQPISTESTLILTTAAATATLTTLSQTRQIPNNTNVTVLRSAEVTYRGYSFLALQVQVPSNGLSKSENWCREYQHICEHFSRRPTGCGLTHAHATSTSICSYEYNSDMNIGSVLGCNPSRHIANVINSTFQNISPPARPNYNAFGFHTCDALYCQKTIKDSMASLTYMTAFWEANDTIMYTVCR